MQKGFIFGVLIGAAAMSAYDMGSKAKSRVDCQKEKIKRKIEEIFD